MALTNLRILVETGKGIYGEQIQALFNPNRLTMTKSANWSLIPVADGNVPASHFTHGEPATLSLELFFDGYEKRENVRDTYVKRIFALTMSRDNGDFPRPPLCRLFWGLYTFEDFDWVLQSVQQTYSLFLENGTPVRATVQCSFRQWRSDAVERSLVQARSPQAVKTRVLRRGESLDSIAAEEYGDPSAWRRIAEANGINNPRNIEPGRVLAIPAIKPAELFGR